MKGLKILLIIAAVLTTPGCTGFFFFFPEKGLRSNPNLERFPPEDIYFHASDGTRLHGWFFKAVGERNGTVLVMHGNAENISTHINSVLWLVNNGYDLFAFDYRGYGLSEGKTTVDGVHLDGAAALDALFTLPQVDKERLFVLGQSVGGPIAVYTTATSPHRKKIRGLILDSAFSSYRRISREKLGQIFITWPFQYPLSYLFNNRYSPDKWIKKIPPVPVIIIHGDSDNVVPVHHGSILFDEALEPKQLWIVPGAGHIYSFASEDIRNRLLEFMKGR